ncbi:MAG: mismatch repair protein MutS2 [Acidobacteriota bacterium]|jgi:DNA mismatch repair protein MutS2|nr:mismatch repair protein MutS2 [Acidobacteriota bacterium]
MNDQAFQTLEYEGARSLVRRYAQTPMGRARAEELAPLDSAAEVRRALSAVSECAALRERGARWSFAELSDPAEAIARLRIEGTILDPLVLLELARLCEQAADARAAVAAEREAAPVLWESVAELPRTLPGLAARVFSKILPSGELDDRASPELARIRSDIVRMRSTITRSLESLMRRSEEAIQDQLVTLRNDRFVIPVRSDHRGRVAGVAHGSSSSGATVFVEPLETIESNNELQSLRETEAREVTRILLTLTEELRAELPAVELAAAAVAELDFVGAKTALATHLRAVEPVIDEEGALELVEARHPLLEENLREQGLEVVPVSLRLDAERPVMVISGANAGGKTVVLKTAGLLALMALSGLHVPAQRARVPLYQSVLADIGDRQSLAANLSTFTSHVSNIRHMVELCRRPALVLLDEVGTGTDPEEGSALGVAVVDHFRRECGAHVIATTHYSGLKMYASNEDAVENASVEFDERTLQPTYRLLVGVAGSSAGLEIARRFRLPEEIINAARSRVDERTLAADAYLRRIQREAEEAEHQRRALEEERRAVAEHYAALDLEAARRERERQAEFARTLERAVSDFERQARELYSKIEDRAQRVRVEREAERRAAELRREAQKARAEARPASTRSASAEPGAVRVVKGAREDESQTATTSSSTSSSGEPTRAIATGDEVRLTTLGMTGVVERVSDGEAEVRVKNLRFRERVSNLELVAPSPKKQQKDDNTLAGRLRRMQERGTEVKLKSSRESADAELNLIGQTTDDARDRVDRFLDEAYLYGHSHVRIIHGHGTGALRRAVAELLRSHPHVARFDLAPDNQGGAGATVVELKQ